jgi:hypothetical protein
LQFNCHTCLLKLFVYFSTISTLGERVLTSYLTANESDIATQLVAI